MTNSDRLRDWRDRKRAKGLCINCGKRKVFTGTRAGIIREFSRCIKCLKEHASYQDGYRRKMSESKSSGADQKESAGT